MPKLVVMLRVKDGIFFVHEWLACFEKIADEIVVLDNGSTDGTYEILKGHPKVVDIIRTEGYNEGRDKNLLYKHVRLRNPDWIMWVDVDEIFEARLERKHFDRLMNNRLINKYAFRRFHFIDRQYFAGSWYWLTYSSGPDRLMWRESPSGYFEDFILDSPNVKGIKGLKIGTTFRLKHLGYISKELVDKKADIYRTVIAKEKESGLQKMYLQNERKIKWSDNRTSVKVIGINLLLDCIRLRYMIPSAFKKARKLIAN